MRIVSLTPSITEALCMLGLESSLVGVTDYCLHPADIVASKERVGGTKTPRIPDIQRLRPDVVIVNTDENRRQTFEGLQSVGLHVLVTQTDSLDQIEATWLQLGEATGTTGLANECRKRIASARAYNLEALRGIRSLPTLVPVWRDPWMASGSGTYIESLLAECGFRNIMSRTDRKWISIALSSTLANHGYKLPEVPR
jgi:ABC-type Fe3+-hydroxamate transport system substrate-binding protein